MPDEANAPSEVEKRRKSLIFALFGILLALAAIVGLAYVMGISPFGDTRLWPIVPKSPASEATETAETTRVPVPLAVPLPSAEDQRLMYWEQVASAQQINDLVADRFAYFELGEILLSDSTADIRVHSAYRDGSELNGWMLLRKFNDAWFFSMITRDGNPKTTPIGEDTDLAVAKAIAQGNAANQEIVKAILDGGYTKITVNKVTEGSRTAMVDVTYSGGKLPDADGQITCIAKEAAGVPQWFITGFAKF